MAVSTTTSSYSNTGNGSALTFTFPFPILSEDAFTLTITDGATVTAGVLAPYGTTPGSPTAADYSVDLGFLGTNSFTVRFFATFAPASGAVVKCVRNQAFTQTLSLTQGDKIPAKAIEKAFDALTMQAQTLHELILSGAGYTGPAFPVQATSNMLGWDTVTNTLRNYTAFELSALLSPYLGGGGGGGGAYFPGVGLTLTGSTFDLAFGSTGTTACVGNDSRLSDARTPISGSALGAATATTAATGDNTTKVATTAWVRSIFGIASGICPLDGSGKVASTYLPSYVDDVLEYANLAAFPGTGTSGIIYVTLDTGKIYRWSGSAYTEITSSPGSTDAVAEGSTNLYYTNARADARVQNAKGTASPAMNGTAAAGSGTTWAPIDHIHPSDTSKVSANNPTFTGNAGVLAPMMQTKAIRDVVSIVASVPSSNFDAISYACIWYTTNATANWTINIRGDGSNTLNSLLAVGESISIVFNASQGATAYYPNTIQVDGTTQTVKWLSGVAPTAGNASSVDSYSFTCIKIATNGWTVLGCQSKFA